MRLTKNILLLENRFAWCIKINYKIFKCNIYDFIFCEAKAINYR